jgi:hypothetical protein
MDQVSKADQMKARGLAHNGRRDYNLYIRARPVTSPFNRVITSMLRVRSAAEIRAILDNRITWVAVHHWRSGRRRPPQWVLERLAEVIRADAAQLLTELAAVETQRAPGTQHPGTIAALRRINAARHRAP